MAAETSNYGEEAASTGLPQFAFDTWGSQIFWLAITFAILYLVLAHFILPRIGEGISERSDRIADDLDAASRLQKEAEEASATYERMLSDAQAKARNIAETTNKSVNEEIAAETEAAEAEFATKQIAAEDRIADIRQAALAKIDDVAQDTIGAIVEKVAGVKPTAAQVKKALKG